MIPESDLRRIEKQPTKNMKEDNPRWWIKHMSDLDHAQFVIKRRLLEVILNDFGVVADADHDAIAEKILFDLSDIENKQLTAANQEVDEYRTLYRTALREKNYPNDVIDELQSTLSSYKVIAEEMAKVLEIAKRQAKDRTNFERFDSLLTRYSELTKKA